MFLRKIHVNSVKFSTAKTAAYANTILELTSKVIRAFPIGILGFTAKKTIEVTSARIVMANRAIKIFCCRCRMVQLIRLLE